MSLYLVNELVLIPDPESDTERVARILKIQRDRRLKECYVTLRDEYDPSKTTTIHEDDVLRSVPLQETGFYATHSDRNEAYFVAEIQGYPRRILSECANAPNSKPMPFLSSNHKDVELKHDFTSTLSPIVFDDTTNHKMFNSFTSWNPQNVLQFGAGDIRMSLNMFIDFKRFHKLKMIKIIEIDSLKFHRIEHLFDGLVRILKNHKFSVKKEYEKRSEVLPIKMTLKHRPTGRTIIFYRQILWNVMDTERNHKYQLICNWLDFTDDALDELFQDVLRQKMSRKQCSIISTQRLTRNIKKQLMIYQCGEMDVFQPAQTVYAYALCNK